MKFFRIFASIIIIFAISFSSFYGINKIKEGVIVKQTENYKCILSIYNIDTFEGGRGSRRQFLLKIARNFEKKNKGVLVMVTDMTIDGINEEIENNRYPDMISFGTGINIQNLRALKTNNNVKSGYYLNEELVTSWCNGFYFLIAKNDSDIDKNEFDKIIISQNQTTLPLLACYNEKFKIKEMIIKEPLYAYIEFVSGKCDYMIGTQRDIVRLSDKGVNVKCKKLENYNDLYQYIGITSNDKIKIEYSKQFIEFLLSEESQKLLSKICMFSPYYEVDFIEGNLNNIKNSTNYASISFLTPLSKIKELQTLTNDFYLKKSVDEKSIKNILI